MFPGINPSQMKAAMKQMGIKQEEIDASRVIIERENGNIVIDNPSVMKINMQGQESWQITGESKEEEKEKFSEEDVKIVMEKTGKSVGEVKGCLERVGGDLSEAILELG
ncbi:hypothetical protein CMI46_02875 [Candidatus Pacearchaeota archaeon]|nr:hypothetical protein [Candidatus Pacearchaeota archaeon]